MSIPARGLLSDHEPPWTGAARGWALWALLIPLVAIAAGNAAYWISSTGPREYQSTATLLFRDPQLTEIVSGVNVQPQDPTREAQTNLDLVQSRAVALRVAQRVPQAGSADDLKRDVSVANKGGSNLVGITATNRSPDGAALIANTWASQYIAFRREADRAQILESIGVIDRRLASLSPKQASSAEGKRLREQRNNLAVVASLQSGNAELVDRAIAPESASSPRPLRAALIAGILVLAAGLVVAALVR